MRHQDLHANTHGLAELIAEKVEKLRPRLLDLSRRNPLVSTPLDSRHGSYVRVVDELPDVLFFRLSEGKRFRFDPLPDFDDEPADEQTEDFRERLNLAMAVDEEYAAAIQQIDLGDSDAPTRELAAERQLRDRLRGDLGLPDRGTHENPRLHEHARAHGISPFYDLPIVDNAHADGRHTDDAIQTLLLPDAMERTLSRIRTKCRTWQQETGLNVMQAAFGYMEWSDPDGRQHSFSPLILVPVTLTKFNSVAGTRFNVTGSGEDAGLNTVLNEKLRREFGVELPAYDGGSVEEYLAILADNLPRRLDAKIRRFVTFGAFPSAQMAMYHDLDTRQRDFSANELLRQLLGGAGASVGPSLFADEYEVDDPYVERRVPLLVADADSSQFSTLVDVVDGRNIAVEGPPGTGKSQTIVNAIAAALTSGKKVLFIAEKMAALEVVRARLEHLSLGEFALPLLAASSSRQQVLESIRDRLTATDAHRHNGRSAAIAGFQEARQRLAAYIDLMTREFADTGLTTHQILGRALLLEDRINGLDLPEVTTELTAGYTQSRTDEIVAAARHLVQARGEAQALGSKWEGLRRGPLDRFTADEALHLAAEAARLCHQAVPLRETLNALGSPREATVEDVRLINAALTELAVPLSHADTDMVTRLAQEQLVASLRELLDRCAAAQAQRAELSAALTEPFDEALSLQLSLLPVTCREAGIDTLNRADLALQHNDLIDALANGERAVAPLDVLCRTFPALAECTLATLATAGHIIRRTPRQALLLRSSTLTDPKATRTLALAAERLQELRAERDRLKALFDIEQVTDADQLCADAEVLRSAGTLAGLSGRFRQARRRWRSTLRGSRPFNKFTAAAELNQMADWKRDTDRFAADQEMSNLLGSEFRGIDTDIENLAALAGYLTDVEQQFAAFEMRTLRHLLKTADLDVLSTLAELRLDGYQCTYPGLAPELAERRTRLRQWEAARAEVDELRPRLRGPNTMRPAQLTGFAHTIDSFTAEAAQLADEPLGQALGRHWSGLATTHADVAAELASAEILQRHAAWTELLCRVVDQHRVDELREATAADAAPAAEAAMVRLREHVDLPLEALEPQSSYRVRAELCAALSNDRSGLIQHAQAHAHTEHIRAIGFADELDALDTAGHDVDSLPDLIEARIFRSLARHVHQRHGAELADFKHEGLDELRQQLAGLDKKLIAGSRQEARGILLDKADPPVGIGIGRKTDYTELSLINHELSKSKRHIPVRDLTRRAGRALLELKPCWMMSPLAVAQYLDDQSVQFDLCIIDEASQMTPEHAIGALARAKQAMIVGDTNQLPPTNFFRNIIAEDDDDDEEIVEESVLELANGAFRPSRRLRWHYRSRHSGLIAFSNRTVYDDDLIVFPSATEERAEMGVSLRKVDGIYKSGTNPIEAEAIAKAAVEFMRRQPSRSLGVVTLNQKQRELVEEKIDHMLNRDAVARAYVQQWEQRHDGLESYFVKNLENVQGDERDVIFIGTVYGPNSPAGKVYQRFGPINGVAGRRRLNVLFSRAKQQIVTFTSMTASDITADADRNPGAYMLKGWLEYAKTGRLETGEATGREPDSDLEEYVAQQIRSMGCEAVPQVGVAGFFIDIGVRHPDWPHGYLLGVECDGATYHSAKSARDRDRLRQEILERLGWQLHRVWSTNWFDDPATEADKLRRAIEQRLAEVRSDHVGAAIDDESAQDTTGDIESTAGHIPDRPIDLAPPTSVPPKPGLDQRVPDAPKVKLGCWVRLRHLDGARGMTEGVVAADRNVEDAARRILVTLPLGQAILGAEAGEVVNILVDGRMQRVEIEEIRR